MTNCYQCGVGMAVQWVIRDGKRIFICDNCCSEFIDEGLDARRTDDY